MKIRYFLSGQLDSGYFPFLDLFSYNIIRFDMILKKQLILLSVKV